MDVHKDRGVSRELRRGVPNYRRALACAIFFGPRPFISWPHPLFYSWLAAMSSARSQTS